jgi:uncharacterized small protein (DUF1192 family)
MTIPVFSGGKVNDIISFADKISAANDISPGELSQRVAVIKRFKELLKAQRDRFQAYLNSLEKQAAVIQSGSADDLMRYVELEEKIVSDIFLIQKVIDPLEDMYHSVSKGSHSPNGIPAGTSAGISESSADGEEVFGLKEAINSMKTEAVIRAERNRAMLSERMASLRSEIRTLRSNPYARKTTVTAAPTQIDIKG